MTPFEYIAVIISVVIGMSLTQLIAGVTHLFQQRARPYWLHILWIAITFVGLLFFWWSIWNLRAVETWSFLTFLVLLAFPVLAYVATSLLLPYPSIGAGFDSKTYYFENARGFFVVSALCSIDMLLFNFVAAGRIFFVPGLLPIVLFAALLFSAAVIRNEKYHVALAVVFLAAFGAWVVGFGALAAGS